MPLISIVEVTCQAAEKQGLKRVGLFGTRFTMQGRFYSDALGKAGITTVLPAPDEQTYIHGKYMGELVNGIFLPDTREGLLSIVRRLMLEERIDGLILGGTELPLIMRNTEDQEIPFWIRPGSMLSLRSQGYCEHRPHNDWVHRTDGKVRPPPDDPGVTI